MYAPKDRRRQKQTEKKSAKQIKKIGAQYRSAGIEWKDKIEREADIGGVTRHAALHVQPSLRRCHLLDILRARHLLLHCISHAAPGCVLLF